VGQTRDAVVQHALVDVGSDTNTMTITIRKPVGTTSDVLVNLLGSGL